MQNYGGSITSKNRHNTISARSQIGCRKQIYPTTSPKVRRHRRIGRINTGLTVKSLITVMKTDGVAWAQALHREPVNVDVSMHEGEKVKRRTIWSRRYVCVLWDQRELVCEAAWTEAADNGRHAASAIGKEFSASDSKVRQEHIFNTRSHSTIHCASPRNITHRTRDYPVLKKQERVIRRWNLQIIL